MPNAMWRQGIGEEGEENQKRENSIVRKGKAILGREEHENTGRLVLELRFADICPCQSKCCLDSSHNQAQISFSRSTLDMDPYFKKNP